MKNLLLSNKLVLLGVSLGSLGGLAYWHFVGCAGGACPITSNWFSSTAYGALLGGLLASSFSPSKS